MDKAHYEWWASYYCELAIDHREIEREYKIMAGRWYRRLLGNTFYLACAKHHANQAVAALQRLQECQDAVRAIDAKERGWEGLAPKESKDEQGT